MAHQHQNKAHPEPPFPPLVNEWATCVLDANETTQEMLGGFAGTSDPRDWRRQWFDALTDNTDAYLRSPTFLQAMKAHIQATILAGRRSNTSNEGYADGSSMSPRGLMAMTDGIGGLDTSVHSRLEQLEQRVSALEGKLGETSQVDGWDRFLDALRIPRTEKKSAWGVTPHEVVYEEGPLRLLRYHNSSVRFAEPILICFALVNRPYILDLQVDRSVVQQLLAGGFDVYLIDWGVPTLADRNLRLHDYINRFLRNVTDVVCEHAGTSRLNLLGYCMGGTFSTIFTAIHHERVRNLILMATPIDFDDQAGLLNVWAKKEHFDVDALIDAYGNCPGEFLQYCFQLMKPVQNFAQKYLTFCDKLDDQAFLDNFFALERWANDSIPVAGETFREYVKTLYQQNRLVKGEMSLDGVAVQLEKIVCPILLLVAEHDHLVPPDSTQALQHHVRSQEVQSMSIAAGHIGLAVSSKAHRRLWPEATQWIADHSTTCV